MTVKDLLREFQNTYSMVKYSTQASQCLDMGVTSAQPQCTGPSRGGYGQNRRYREIGTLNFSRTLQTARNNLSPDTAAEPEITSRSYALCGT